MLNWLHLIMVHWEQLECILNKKQRFCSAKNTLDVFSSNKIFITIRSFCFITLYKKPKYVCELLVEWWECKRSKLKNSLVFTVAEYQIQARQMHFLQLYALFILMYHLWCGYNIFLFWESTHFSVKKLKFSLYSITQ